MEFLSDPSSDSSRSLTPPQARLPLSSSLSEMAAGSSSAEETWVHKRNIDISVSQAPVSCTMNKDSCYTYVHMHKPHHADLFEDFCRDKLPADDIYVPPNLQPINPEEEDDVVPDQHAAYGVQKATQKAKEPAWRDLGLAELMARGPKPGASKGRAGGRRKVPGSDFKGLPR
ncbi:Apc13p protein-domain-containing protein [Chaetomium strumarium]|uniref:Apc13p protein-domain-containing protein n=1 Tax=Chaetomium strumarium TaxID=1170767 RepID=A0AAJ0GYJ7_9PEZI|nr:Apc13p protein-domain-containing protein [Chaetomium strumarium]